MSGRRGGSLSRRRLALFGLTFKAGTDDLRASPALEVAALLRQAGAELVGHDLGLGAGGAGPAGPPVDPGLLTVVDDPYVAAKGADAVVVLTEWPQFRALDWARLAEAVATPTLVDTRNLLDPAVLRRAGFSWVGVGRAA